MSNPDVSMSDLALGQKFRLFCDPANEGYVAENDLGQGDWSPFIGPPAVRAGWL